MLTGWLRRRSFTSHVKGTGELVARRDPELREKPVQVRSDRSRREVELLTDFAVRHSPRRHLGYLKLLSRELITRGWNTPSALLARGTQLLACAFAPGSASQRVEHLSRSRSGGRDSLTRR